MKILYYNWVDYLDAEDRGGGVSVYQRNLMQALDGIPGVEAWFLSSGISYDLFSAKPRWERMRHGVADHPRRYEIVNSGVLSPSRLSFGNPAQLSHDATLQAFLDFLRANGPFDVVHFNNLEGIPAEVLDLKQTWPQTRVLLTLHNYYPFCPQVNLWHQEKAHCADFGNGDRCRSCLPARPDERMVRLAGAVAFNLKKIGSGPGSLMWNFAYGPAMQAARRMVRLVRAARKGFSGRTAPRVAQSSGPAEFPTVPQPAESFRARRQRMVDLINRNCDHVLGVSQRVSQIARVHGIDPKLVTTAYIGTQRSERFAATTPRPAFLDADGILTLGFLGYMRRDKGYFFLVEALLALPKEMAARIRLVLAAPRIGDGADLRALSAHLHEVVYADGYSHDQLDALLAGVTLGVVPVLWEDNLPQVAIEMHARHIPLLTSDRGGARELGNCDPLVFQAGNAADFARHLQAVLDGEIDLPRYWATARPPLGMAQHIAALLTLYRR